ncbi:DNA topoisomerase [Lactobacillus sp. ESL0679]|uniref:DNA topoisomerase n=1 Tax=Lactobacillus sp. ESL0679 TaxID=2983209 RepID=UPI0032AEDB49
MYYHRKIYRQAKSRLEYVKKPFYEVRFRDSNQNVFKRTDEEAEQHRFPTENDAAFEMSNYQPSGVVIDSKVEKKQQPPALLDLSHLSILVGKKGFSSKTFLATYQKMYEKSILSYPRTEDTKITQAQFDQLLPLVDQIAQVIGLSPTLLTHRRIRKKFLVKAATHGANRPGINVPTSLDEIEKQFGKCGREIYLAAAKSFLATLGEDYLYEQQKAHLTLYPAFTCTINVPKAKNYKLIFDEAELTDDTPDPDKKIMEFGTSAFPTVYQGHNPKPQPPTHSFIISFLKKNEIGTGATQESTLASITTGNNALVKNTKERYSLTYPGLIQAILCSGTYIASPKVTEQLQEKMKQVKQGKFDYRNVPFLINQIVNYDLPAEQKNAANLSKNPQLAKLKQEWDAKNTFTQKEKVKGNWQGKEVGINREWRNYTFTDQELQQLFANKKITINTGSSIITGKLEQQSYKGKKFVGFKQETRELLADETHAVGLYQPQNITIRFKKIWDNHTFTNLELQQLLAGQNITFQAMDKKGKLFEAKGKLAEQVYEEKQGRQVIKKIKFWGFSLEPQKLIADDTHFVGIFIPTGKEVRFKNSFGGHSFTNQELALLLNGDSISFTGTSKKGSYPVTGKLQTYTFKGHKIFGFKPKFKKK